MTERDDETKRDDEEDVAGSGITNAVAEGPGNVPVPEILSGRQTRGTRGSSNQGRPDPEERTGGEDTIGRTAEPPRGPLPPGAQAEDYLGGDKPHKTRQEGATGGASGVKNEVL